MRFMYNIAVMGDPDSIYGFGALGLSTYPVKTEEEAKKVFKALSGGNTAIIYITEATAVFLGEEIEKTRDSITPAVILIPGISGNTGNGMESVKTSALKAIGSDILFNG